MQGLRKGNSNDIAYPVFYHLVIDKKPKVGNRYLNVLIYTDPETGSQMAIMPKQLIPQMRMINLRLVSLILFIMTSQQTKPIIGTMIHTKKLK